MRIFAAHDGGSGCAYYRIKVPLEELARHGHDVTFRSAGNERGNRPVTQREMEGYDIIVGQRFNHHQGMGMWRKARVPSSRLIYELDDDVFSVTPVNWQAFNVYKNPEIRDAVTHMAGIADLVTVTTEHLAAVMREETGNPNVLALPNFIPGWVTEARHPRGPRPAVGWQGGASHGMDVGIIVKPVRQFLRRFPGWDLRLGGTDYRETFKVACGRCRFTPWIPVFEDAAGYYATMDFDIGLAPLLGTDFDLSKSCVKVLEYAAHGIPSIASDNEVYRAFIRHGENGFLVRREHEWGKYLAELASDDALREKMGAAARETARRWTIEGNYHLWEQAYEGLFKGHG